MHEQNEQRPAENKDGGLSPSLIALIALGILAVIFILQNGSKKEVSFLMLDVRAPVWLVIVLSMVVGVVLDRLFGFWWRRRKAKND